MEASPTSLKRLKLGKLKVVRRSLLQRYEHQPFISCLAGFYSCRWKRYQREKTEPGKCCCNMRECMFFPLLVAAFCFSLVFLYTWGEGKNDYNSFDWYNYGNLGFWFLWSLVILIVAAVLFAYISLLLIGTFLVLGFSIASLFALSILWRDHRKTVRLSFQVTAPYLHIGAIAIMIFLAWPVALHAIRADKKVTQVIIVGPYLAILLFLFLIPLGMYSPCIREMGTLGPKPALIGHRGAPMLAPENTEMSFLKTIEHGGDGLETDVAISYDGVPFLMHDDTLRRTTNIDEVYPNDTAKAASFFSWDALQKLNAGKWFLKNKPFVGMGSLSKADRNQAKNQSIYTLNSFLRLADSHNKLVIFDLYRPPEKHPYRNLWLRKVLDVILKESKIKRHLVLWLHNSVRSFVQSVAPGFQHTMGRKAPIEDLLKHNIVKLNLVYTDMSSEDIRKYAEANITTNFYVVNEPWLYSLAWCSGAHSVTTNAVHLLKDLNQPLFLMTPQQYNTMWILTDLTAAFLISLIFALHWWREKNFSCCAQDSNPMIESGGTYNKFKTELSDMPAVLA
ncbi:glycerophosphodiester phosphodiesterase domain-containing protein 4 isoform X2 [Taeniopygia guttata]|uniref:glycerophosphodiester phosphodiesterase domain-containing protein 4 isoform X2 n=1 Tax=Taeniopygia guttata TaxID=59729 RepID=UPI0011AEF3D9|nr:glycerophosphodiester phosphodiesterase domain-containing protein 4 isoform X2 [Taeniopygia guttata]